MPFSKTLFFLATTPLFANFLYAETLWVQGVTAPKESDWILNCAGVGGSTDKSSVPTSVSGQGWYDSNKILPIEVGKNDSNLCWAATASNMLEWWQTQNKDVLDKIGAEVKYSGVVNDGTTENPHYSTKIYKDIYSKTFTNSGGFPDTGLNWYFNGVVDSSRISESSGEFNAGGFYSVLEKEIQNKIKVDFSFNNLLEAYVCNNDTETECKDLETSLYLKNAIESGKVIGLRVGNHAVTCWGADFDTDGMLTSIYITDSDDNLNCGLRKVSTIDINGTKYDYGMGLIDLDYQSDLELYKDYYFTLAEIYTLDTGRETLQMLAAAIPEPSMFGLFVGLGALALVGSRRRRK